MSVGFSKILKPASQLLNRTILRNNVQVRNGGTKMNILPTKWDDLQFREYLAFYFTLFGAPLLMVSAYVNICIGSAKLKPIPEGYEPKEEEYERHPISRWLMRNAFQSGQMLYETKMHAIWEQWNYSHRAQLIKEIRRVMDSEGDYAGWTYRTSDAKYARAAQRERQERMHTPGTFT